MNKVLIKSHFNRIAHRKFYRFHAMRSSIVIYFLLIFVVIMFFLAIKTSVSGEGNADNLAIWIFALMSLLLVPLVLLTRIAIIVNKDAKRRGDRLETLEFTKHKITRAIEGAPNYNTFTWPMIEKVYEFKDYYFFYTQLDAGFVIVKEDIVEGSVEYLNKLITGYMKPNKKGKIAFKPYKGDKK